MAQYSEDTKAAAMGALLEGQAVNKVAQEFPQIPKGTIKSWKTRLNNKSSVAGDASQKTQLGEKVIAVLEGQLDAQNAICEQIRNNPEWLFKQSAEGLAVLLGVISDKCTRTFEMLDFGEEAEGTDG